MGGKWGGAKYHLGDLHVTAEALGEVLDDDAVRGGEEGEHVRDEVALAVGERLPVLAVGAQVDLLGRPEAGLRLLVHLPHLRELDGEQHEALLVLLEHGLLHVGWVDLVGWHGW
mgnify:CR=1 FL=1